MSDLTSTSSTMYRNLSETVTISEQCRLLHPIDIKVSSVFELKDATEMHDLFNRIKAIKKRFDNRIVINAYISQINDVLRCEVEIKPQSETYLT